ncbi:MAG: 30S ribosomal protein S16 [Alcanivorax sp.]|nr:30S ribosomal protein S16 [Alcanivorax sp.]
MVVIRLARGGSKKRPFYNIIVTDSRNARDGRFIAKLGYFNPIARGGEIPLNLDLESLDAWVAKGAQLSDRVKTLAKQARKSA